MNRARAFSQLIIRSLTRTSFTNVERLPKQSALLVVANHASTIDPLLLFSVIQRDDVTFVGPGDFQLQFPANIAVKLPNIIRVRRTNQLEMASIKRMMDVLKQGHCLALFPEGGTWEKPITDAKAGATYLSMMTTAPILPIGLGGTYQSWSQVVRLQRPHLSVNVGELIPAVSQPEKRAQRDQVQIDATMLMMQRIYDLLPPADQARYDTLAHTVYGLQVETLRGKTPELLPLPDGEVLGEILQKPNLMAPFIQVAKLTLSSLLTRSYQSPTMVAQAARSLLESLHGDFAGYMEYRLGETKSQRLYASLETLIEMIGRGEFTALVLRPTMRKDTPLSR
ncbi:MAG: 1-acyl-sn-glycerol-3-phosphate acyltransferase [Anaerolineae bacterium]|nr:1-acyl-sn-glycerol-3-phosphate acyltransferase [Anaerolineae bacterium]